MNKPSALRANRAMRLRRIAHRRSEHDMKLRACQMAAERGMLIPYPEVWIAHLRESWPEGIPEDLMVPIHTANARIAGLSKGL